MPKGTSAPGKVLPPPLVQVLVSCNAARLDGSAAIGALSVARAGSIERDTGRGQFVTVPFAVLEQTPAGASAWTAPALADAAWAGAAWAAGAETAACHPEVRSPAAAAIASASPPRRDARLLVISVLPAARRSARTGANQSRPASSQTRRVRHVSFAE